MVAGAQAALSLPHQIVNQPQLRERPNIHQRNPPHCEHKLQFKQCPVSESYAFLAICFPPSLEDHLTNPLASQLNPSTSTSTPEKTKDSQPQDVDMEAPDSPPETTHANTSSQASGPSGTQANTSSRVNGEGGSSNTKTNFGAPGSSWSTKKFNEEYEKAEANLLDRGWESESFGRFEKEVLYLTERD